MLGGIPGRGDSHRQTVNTESCQTDVPLSGLELPAEGEDHRGRQADRRAGHPPGLRVPLRERRVLRPLPEVRRHLRGAARLGHQGHGHQVNLQENHGRGQCPHHRVSLH